MTPVTVVILTWNGIDYTRRCLETLRATTDHPEYRIVVVDNGSTDGTLEYLEELDWITLVRNGKNLGFSRANNIGIRAAGPEHDIVLLNNDTEIIQADWLTRMQEASYRSPDIGCVGCRLRRLDGTLQHAGAYMPLDTFWGQQIGGGERDINQYNQDREVESVVFACVYIKRRTLDDVGLLDEDYFCYFEDTDYCQRLHSKGYRIICCGVVTVIHHENASTAVNEVAHSKLFYKGQQIFRSKWEGSLQAQRYTREIGWHSILNRPTGYAISSRSLITALDEQGVRVSYKYLYGPGTVLPLPEPDSTECYLSEMIRRRKLKPDIPQVVYGQGDMFHANFGAYKVGFTMLETDRMPAEWVRKARLMDEIWVPSHFNAQTFRDSGLDKPIYVVPLGVDPDHFNPGILRSPLNGMYTFLSIFEWGERKAPELLLRAFNEEFRADEPVLLVAKVLNVDPGVDVEREIANLALNPNGGRIHVSLNQVVPTHQLGVLYRSADCFVLTTRGEGWGMPVIEAMACGVPVIATDWSAHRDFMNARNAYPLPVAALVPAVAKCPYYRGFRWAEPSYPDLKRLMRHVFLHQEEARLKGEIASREVRENWSWNQAARKIITRLDAIRSRPESPQKATGIRPSVL